MELEHEVRSLRNEFRGASDIETLRTEAGVELTQDVVSIELIVPSGLDAFIGLAQNRVLHPLRTRRQHPNLAVMQNFGIARTHLRGLHPQVLGDVAFHADELVVDGALGRYDES